MKKRKIFLLSIVIIVLALFIGVEVYIQDYYLAEVEAFEVIKDTQDYVVEIGDDYITFIPDKADNGIIFYPGGKVQYESYAPMMARFAENGVLAVLLKMPANLAVLDSNAADGVKDSYPDISHWYMAGHSLGGAIASSYVSKHVDEFDGLILFAAYSIYDLTETDLKVYSFYGTCDKVLNLEKYEENRMNLPDGYVECVIDGGCHSYFGNYGMQEGDGIPTITCDEQQKLIMDILKDNGF